MIDLKIEEQSWNDSVMIKIGLGYNHGQADILNATMRKSDDPLIVLPHVFRMLADQLDAKKK